METTLGDQDTSHQSRVRSNSLRGCVLCKTVLRWEGPSVGRLCYFEGDVKCAKILISEHNSPWPVATHFIAPFLLLIKAYL